MSDLRTDAEAGRLDRILAEQALEVAVKPSQFELIVHDLVKYTDAPVSAADARELIRLLDQARHFAAVLEAECAALTEALDAVTHEHIPGHPADPEACQQAVADGGLCCDLRDEPVHRTPARVRAELGNPT